MLTGGSVVCSTGNFEAFGRTTRIVSAQSRKGGKQSLGLAEKLLIVAKRGCFSVESATAGGWEKIGVLPTREGTVPFIVEVLRCIVN